METKFKVGDKVLLTKPKEKYLEDYVGKVFEVTRVDADNKIYYCAGVYLNYWFCESWLTKIEEQPTEQVPEQVPEQVAKPIDWEQRRWDLASKVYAEMENVTLESAVRQAEIFIKYYKQTLK
jgi:hypothetical protein